MSHRHGQDHYKVTSSWLHRAVAARRGAGEARRRLRPGFWVDVPLVLL